MDFAASVRPAGAKRDSSGETAADSLHSGWGRGHDSAVRNDGPVMTHGKATVKSESVGRCFNSLRKSKFEAFQVDLGERIYWSRKHEPLGHGTVRGHTLPPVEHVYGRPNEKGQRMSDVFSISDDGVHEKDKLEVGKQRRREYNWPACVDTSFSFGQRDVRQGSAAEALNLETPETLLQPKRLADFRSIANPPIGQSAPYLQGKPPVAQDFVFGGSCVRSGDSAAACIHENFVNADDLTPDRNLGKGVSRIIHA